MGWLIALAFFFLLAILPLGVSAIYSADGFLLDLIVGPLHIRLFPRKDKKKEKSRSVSKQPKSRNTQRKPKEKKASSTKGGSLRNFLPLLKVAFDFLGDLRRKLVIKKLELQLTMAGGDPADLAVHYGQAWGILGTIQAQLERFFNIRKKELNVRCDFVEDQTLIYARVDVIITLGRAVVLVVRYGIRAFKEFLKITKLKKGGAEDEQ